MNKRADRRIAARGESLARFDSCDFCHGLIARAKAGQASGFTLLEVLVATSISAILVLSINSVLYNAFNLRDRALAAQDQQTRQRHALSIIKRDLQLMLPPNGELAGEIYSQSNPSSGGSQDTIEFYTASGEVADDPYAVNARASANPVVWGDAQMVSYSLQEWLGVDSQFGLVLVRTVYRNLLSSYDEPTETAPILPNVKSLRFEYYDGDVWLSEWDAETQETPLPTAVRVVLALCHPQDMEDQLKGIPIRQERSLPVELLVPISMQEFTLATIEDETEEENPESNNDGDANGGDNTPPDGGAPTGDGVPGGGVPGGDRAPTQGGGGGRS